MAGKRKSISKKLRFEVFKRDKFTCVYCGATAPDVLLHIDHIEPVSKGGSNAIENLCCACMSCNQGKSDRKLERSDEAKKSFNQVKETAERMDQLKAVLKWKKEVINSKNKEVDEVIKLLEENYMDGNVLTESGEIKVKVAYAKHGLDEVLNHFNDWLINCEWRKKNGYREKTLDEYIKNKKDRQTPTGKRKYAMGVAYNKFSRSFLSEVNTFVLSLPEEQLEGFIYFLKNIVPEGYVNNRRATQYLQEFKDKNYENSNN